MKKGLGLNMDKYFSRARERYVLDYVKSELIQEYGLDTSRRGGFKVTRRSTSRSSSTRAPR